MHYLPAVFAGMNEPYVTQNRKSLRKEKLAKNGLNRQNKQKSGTLV